MAAFRIYFNEALRHRYVTFRAYRALAGPADEDTRRSSPAGGRGSPGNPGCAPHRSRGLPVFVREETGVISICKTILSGTPPDQIRDRTSGLASAPLRDLAVKLAADPHLAVSLITYSDGRQELEVLNTGPPHHTDDTIDHRRFTRQTEETPGWTLSIDTQAGLQDAVTVIRTALLNAAVP
jgi:hypothetical protein